MARFILFQYVDNLKPFLENGLRWLYNNFTPEDIERFKHSIGFNEYPDRPELTKEKLFLDYAFNIDNVATGYDLFMFGF